MVDSYIHVERTPFSKTNFDSSFRQKGALGSDGGQNWQNYNARSVPCEMNLCPGGKKSNVHAFDAD